MKYTIKNTVWTHDLGSTKAIKTFHTIEGWTLPEWLLLDMGAVPVTEEQPRECKCADEKACLKCTPLHFPKPSPKQSNECECEDHESYCKNCYACNGGSPAEDKCEEIKNTINFYKKLNEIDPLKLYPTKYPTPDGGELIINSYRDQEVGDKVQEIINFLNQRKV